jgi:hypothetical protein
VLGRRRCETLWETTRNLYEACGQVRYTVGVAHIIVRRIVMIDNLIKDRMKLVKKALSIVFILSSIYVLAFSVNVFQQRLIAIGLSFVVELVAVVMVYFILWIQVKNSFCTKKILASLCNFFIYSALAALIVFLISLIAYREAFTLISISIVEGTIASSILIKKKYVLAEE